MDYESILFGLQPLLNASSIEELPVQDVYLESYLTVLDQLAVSLRSDTNRTIVGSNGLLKELVRVLVGILNLWFHEHSDDIAWLKLASELIRCIANGLVDHEENRMIVAGDPTLKQRNVLMDYWVGRLLKLDDCREDQCIPTLQMRTIVLSRNLCLDNDDLTKRFAPFIRGPLIFLLTKTQHTYLQDSELAVLGSELLSDFTESYSEGLTAKDLLFLAQFIERASRTIESQGESDIESADDKEEDSSTEIAYSLAQCIETVTKRSDEKKDFYTEPHLTLQIQNCLLKTLDHLTPKDFANKLIVMRRITTSVGYVSANRSNSNRNERDLCYQILLNSGHSYTLAASLIILSNSVQNRTDANEITEKISLEQLIKVGSLLKDPMQFQGYLDILKKLLNLDNAMVLRRESLQLLCSLLKICHDQSKYFTDLSPLIDNLLKKLLAVIPGSSLQKAVAQDSSLLEVLLDRDSIISCLALDKLLVARTATPDHIMKNLWKTAFKFQDTTGAVNQDGSSSVSVFYLFQLSKTCGICLKGASGTEQEALLNNHADDLLSLLKTVASLQGATDRASQSIVNNGKFVAGLVYKLLVERGNLTENQAELRDLAALFFKGPE